MRVELDHLAVAGATLAAAVEHAETVLGVALQAGGHHEVFGTHNKLLGLEAGLYFEAIAIDPDASMPERRRWFALDDGTPEPRLSNWICRVDDLEAAVAIWPEAGDIVSLTRGDLRWKMAVPSSGRLPFDGMFPALIQWDSAHPAPRLDQCGVGLEKLIVRHPDAQAIEALLATALDAPLVHFETGAIGLAAEFRTPAGKCVLK